MEHRSTNVMRRWSIREMRRTEVRGGVGQQRSGGGECQGSPRAWQWSSVDVPWGGKCSGKHNALKLLNIMMGQVGFCGRLVVDNQRRGFLMQNRSKGSLFLCSMIQQPPRRIMRSRLAVLTILIAHNCKGRI